MAFRSLRLLLDEVETGLKQTHRPAMRPASHRLFARETKIPNGARAITARPEVKSELIRVGVGLSSVRFHQRLAYQSVQARAPACRDAPIHRFAIKGMDETKLRCDRAAGPLDDARIADEG